MTKEVVQIYLVLCVACRKKCVHSKKKWNVLKLLLFNEMNGRAQVNLIDMQTYRRV